MKNLLILIFMVPTMVFAQVPNTETFSLQDVVNEIGGGETTLQECFNDANSGGFDTTYNQDSYAPANSLLRFRNYTSGVVFADLSFGGTGTDSGQGLVVPPGDVDFTVTTKIRMNDLSSNYEIFEIQDIATVYYSTTYNNFVIKFNASSTEYRISSNDGLITTDRTYQIGFGYSNIGSISIEIWGGESFTTLSASFDISRGTKEYHLGYSNALSLNQFNGYAREALTVGETGIVYTNLWENNLNTYTVTAAMSSILIVE